MSIIYYPRNFCLIQISMNTDLWVEVLWGITIGAIGRAHCFSARRGSHRMLCAPVLLHRVLFLPWVFPSIEEALNTQLRNDRDWTEMWFAGQGVSGHCVPWYFSEVQPAPYIWAAEAPTSSHWHTPTNVNSQASLTQRLHCLKYTINSAPWRNRGWPRQAAWEHESSPNPRFSYSLSVLLC